MEHLAKMWDAAEPGWRKHPPLMFPVPPGRCSYLDGRTWNLRQLFDPDIDRLMKLGGQRFGNIFCVPVCQGCRACRPARIDVERFKLSRSQRRTLNRNKDLRLELAPVSWELDKFQLFADFVSYKFNSAVAHLVTEEQKRHFYSDWILYHPNHTLEFRYYAGDRLLGVGAVDLGESGAYSHYFFYDLGLPRRRLGIYSFLREVEWCRSSGRSYLYIGFLNLDSPSMRYKRHFSGLEVLLPESGWSTYEDRDR